MSITCTHIEARWKNAAGGGKEYKHTQGKVEQAQFNLNNLYLSVGFL